MRIRFWGTRGSIATPGPSTVRYGGNTSCVELRSARGTLVVFDCGTGARPLGAALAEEGRQLGAPLDGSILLSHTHWDHIQGLPFFEPLFGDGRWDVYGPRGLGASLDQTLAGQMNYQYFPVALDQLGAGVQYHELVEGAFEIGDLVVRTQYLNHPALTVGYRVECDGAVVCYVSDHEPFDTALAGGGDVRANAGDARHVDFVKDADVVIHDAQYTAAEYGGRIGWGHSPIEYVVEVGSAARARRTVLYHHDPSHDDQRIDALVHDAQARAAGRTEVVAAAEGEQIEVSSDAADKPARRTRSAAAEPALEDLAVAIIVLTDDDALRATVVAAARDEHLSVVDLDGAVAATVDGGRVIAVDDVERDSGGLERLRAAISSSARARLGVVAITRSAAAAPNLPAGVTDWLVWPAGGSHMRTKLRAAVLRRACRWIAAPVPADEEDRLAALHALHVLDTEPEARFDRFTKQACERFGVPIALITLVDRDRQWFKSHQGVDISESPRDESFCAHVILQPDVLQVPDVLEDERFADSPAVVGGPRIRFYAGAPLTLHDGCRIGTLCIADHRPRLLDHRDLGDLRRLADEVVTALEAG